MEDDKKKRKKKNKKKNKQANEPTESDPFDAKELSSDSQSHVQETGTDDNGQMSEIVDASNDTRGHQNLDGDGHLVNDNEIMHLAEEERQHWLDSKATLEGKLKELQAEKDAQIQKEAILLESIKQLMKEKDVNSEEEAKLKEKLSELEKKNDGLIKKEGSLEQKIQQLQTEMEAQLQKENSAKESISNLTIDNTKLRTQVVELELSREKLFIEMQQLKEFISSQQLQINNLEMDKKTSENGHLNSDAEAARGQVERLMVENSELVEKVNELHAKLEQSSENGHLNSEAVAARAQVERLMVENSELVEKVNELHAKLEQSGVRTGQLPSDGSVPGAVTVRSAKITGASAPLPDHASGASKMIPVSDSIRSLEDVMVKDERNGELENVNPGLRAAKSSEITQTDEIVQILLDENEVKESNLESESQSDKDVNVSLTDSPLIGAPFRIISFMARYVSGADLVHKK